MKIDFEITDGNYILVDAIILPDDHTYSDSEIEQIKQDRFDQWVANIIASEEDLKTKG